MRNLIYYFPLFLTLIAGLISLLKQKGIAEIISGAISIFVLTSALIILKYPDLNSKYLLIDNISKLMIFTVASIYAATVIYSISYVKYIKNPLFHTNHYFVWINLFAFTMFFSVMVNNLGLLWVGIEATTVTSALLIAIEGKKESIEATWRYILIVSCGLIISLLGTILIYGELHTLNIFLANFTAVENKIIVLGILLTIVGYGTKAGIFPMHTWLPDVHGKAPSPVSAIFSGVLLPVALYGVYRVSHLHYSDEMRNFMFILGFLTIVFSALLMTVQKYYKRLYAYSSMENMGIVLIGIALGGKALTGALIVIIAHAFAKSAVFYLTGNILIRFNETKIKSIHGLIKKMPFTAYCLFFAVLAATGAPPFATFFGEILIFSKLIAKYGCILALILGIFISIAFISANYYTGLMIFSEKEKDIKERKSLVNYIPLINVGLAFATIFLIKFFV
jgi:hydrogenase-4 component F